MSELTSDPGERRQYPRYELMAQVRIRRSRTDYVLDVKNVSLGGALVDLGSLERPAWLEIGKLVEVAIFAIEGAELTVSANGEVVRIMEDEHFRGFAVQFVDLDDGQRASIEALVESARGQQPPPLPSQR